MNARALVAALVTVVLPLAASAESCEDKPADKPKPSYAGDGITQFSDTGRLRWNTTYAARYVDTSDRTNCRWSLYTVNSDGVAKVIKRGNYLSAKIRVERPSRVKVYLKSDECGNWKPA